MNQTTRINRGAALTVLTCMMGTAAFAAQTTVTVSGGAHADPIPLHQTKFSAWLHEPDYNTWTNYSPHASIAYDVPNVIKLVRAGSDDVLCFSNLTPGVTYPYAFTNGVGVTVLSGTFTTSNEPPRTLTAPVYGHPEAGKVVRNFRDLGGWLLPGGNGKRANFGVFYRSANLDSYFMTDGDFRAENPLNKQFGIRTELDLRDGNHVVTVNKSATIEDESYYFEDDETAYDADEKTEYNWHVAIHGVGPAHAFTNAPSVADGSIRYFRVRGVYDVPFGSEKEDIRKTFHVLGTPAYHPVLFHCAGGRDRTGFVAMLIEALCGFREDDVYRDHLAITMAGMSSMYAERVDGNLRALYTYRSKTTGERLFAKYGESLAGHVRAYLEYVGVTAEELAGVTQAFVGETPDEVLARVDAYEAANGFRTLWYVSPGTTNAVHRVGATELVHEPLLMQASDYSSYLLRRAGYTFAGWTEEQALEAGATVRESLWTPVRKYVVRFRDPFGSVLAQTYGEEGFDATAAIPSAPAGTALVRWTGACTNVCADTDVVCELTGVRGYLGTEGDVVSTAPAQGGDVVRKLVSDGWTEYVHYFTNATEAAQLVNASGADLDVTYLVVGGGGAGGDSTGNYFGGGAGGGGGVAGASCVFADGATWTIRVGAGGTSPGGYKKVRGPAGASSISNGTVEVACAPGGGSGGTTESHYSSASPETRAQPGAAGGGADARAAYKYYQGAAGTFASFCDDVAYAQNKGGNSSVAALADGNEDYALAGSGGGAGAAGGACIKDLYRSGNGGVGVYSSISGELRVYGGGGGGGGGIPAGSIYRDYVAAAGYPDGFIPGEGANGGGRGGSGVSTNAVAAQNGADGFGGGGGGAGAGKANAGDGGRGVVIVRYMVGRPDVTRALRAFGTNDASTVVYTATGRTVRDGDGREWLKPGVAATLAATDTTGGLVCGCWRDDSTGELFYGATVTVTPAAFTTYTAVFGRPWVKTADNTLTDGEWTFSLNSKASAKNLRITAPTTCAPHGILNLTTPITNASGAVCTIEQFGEASASSGDGCFNGNKTALAALFLPAETAHIGQRACLGCVNLAGTVCIPPAAQIRDQAFSGCTALTGVHFKARTGTEDLFQLGTASKSYGKQFYNCSGLTGRLELPSAPHAIAAYAFYGTQYGEAILPGTTNVGSLAFYNVPLTNVVFGTAAVGFEPFYSDYLYVGYRTFGSVQTGCRFVFPGQAPILPEYTEGRHATGNRELFGTANGVRFYGSWKQDPEGWGRILAEIGYAPGSDTYEARTSKAPALVSGQDRAIRGTFDWCEKTSSEKTYYGWLIDTRMPDDPPPASGLTIVIR